MKSIASSLWARGSVVLIGLISLASCGSSAPSSAVLITPGNIRNDQVEHQTATLPTSTSPTATSAATQDQGSAP